MLEYEGRGKEQGHVKNKVAPSQQNKNLIMLKSCTSMVVPPFLHKPGWHRTVPSMGCTYHLLDLLSCWSSLC
jgi:hypothetical protein